MHENLKVVLIIYSIVLIIIGVVGLAYSLPDEEGTTEPDIGQAALSTLLASNGVLMIGVVASESK